MINDALVSVIQDKEFLAYAFCHIFRSEARPERGVYRDLLDQKWLSVAVSLPMCGSQTTSSIDQMCLKRVNPTEIEALIFHHQLVHCVRLQYNSLAMCILSRLDCV